MKLHAQRVVPNEVVKANSPHAKRHADHRLAPCQTPPTPAEPIRQRMQMAGATYSKGLKNVVY
jgi:hypothetical protein